MSRSKVERYVLEALRWRGSSSSGAGGSSSSAGAEAANRTGGGPAATRLANSPPSPRAAAAVAATAATPLTRTSPPSKRAPARHFINPPPLRSGGTAWPWSASSLSQPAADVQTEQPSFAASPVVRQQQEKVKQEARKRRAASRKKRGGEEAEAPSLPAAAPVAEADGEATEGKPRRKSEEEEEAIRSAWRERRKAALLRERQLSSSTPTSTSTSAAAPSSPSPARTLSFPSPSSSSPAAAAAAAIAAGFPPPPSYRLSSLILSAPTPREARELHCLALAAGARPDGRHFTLVASRLAAAGDAAGVRQVSRDAAAAGLPRAPHWEAAEVRAHAQCGDFRGAWDKLADLLAEARRLSSREVSKNSSASSSSSSSSASSSAAAAAASSSAAAASASFASAAATAAAALAASESVDDPASHFLLYPPLRVSSSGAASAADHGARALVVALGAAGHAAAAARVVSRLASAGVAPSAATYGALAGAHADSGDGERAEAAARAAGAAEAFPGIGAVGGARDEGFASPEPSPSSRPPAAPAPVNGIALRHVLRAWSRAGRPAAAAAALAAAARAEAEAKAARALATEAAELAAALEDGSGKKKKRKKKAPSLDPPPRDGSPTRAVVLVDEAAYADLIAAHGRAGDLAGAAAALELARANGVEPGPRCFGRLIDAHGAVGDLAGAAAVLSEALASSSSSPSAAAAAAAPPPLRPDAQLFATLMRWVALAGDAERAERTMELAREALGPGLKGSDDEGKRESKSGEEGGGVESGSSGGVEGGGEGGLKRKADAAKRTRKRGGGAVEKAAVGDETPDVVLAKLFAETLFQAWWRESKKQGSSEKLTAALEAWRQLLRSSPLPSPSPVPLSAANNDEISSSPSSFSLDLHSFNHWSAQLALLEALKKLQEEIPVGDAEKGGEENASSSPSSFPDLLVITGRGNRSKDRGAPPVRRAALSLLHSLGCPAALATGNDGCVVVRGSALAELFARERASGRSFGVEEHSSDLVGLDFHSEISLAHRLNM